MKCDKKVKTIRLLLLDNQDSFTWNVWHLFHFLSDVELVVVDSASFDQPMLAAYHGLILSPGPGVPRDHRGMMRAIEYAEYQMPIWGLCLGHQALIEYYGGSLKQMYSVRHGIRSKLQILHRDALWSNVECEPLVGRYHSWVGDESSWPDSLVVTSIDEEGYVMSMSHRRRPIFGVQFHPESYMTNVGVELATAFVKVVRRSIS